MSSWIHPDQQEDEVLLTNLERGSYYYNRIGYKSKRISDRAFDVQGNYRSGLIAVFVKRYEYKSITGREFSVAESQIAEACI
jgi:non-ribosomal peptide synthetase component E (peptide arylation enzyme)